MPGSYRTPGVYVDDIAPRTRVIDGVPTSVAAFVGRAWRGPVDVPIAITGHADYVRVFGGPWHEAPMDDAVRQFFDNGGGQALVVRIATAGDGMQVAATPALFTLASGHAFRAADPGSWGMNLCITIEADPDAPGGDRRFVLDVHDDSALQHDSRRSGGSGASERFAGVSVDRDDARYVADVLARESRLLRAHGELPATAPTHGTVHADGSASGDVPSGNDGGTIAESDVVGAAHAATGTGLYALADCAFNLLCIPPFAPGVADNGIGLWTAASRLCRERRALLIVDAPADWDLDTARTGIADFAALERDHAALYFPRMLAPDPRQPGGTAAYAPCGAVAGVIARTDASRGVWKAPAGREATLRGVSGFAIAGQPGQLSDIENGQLNPLGINCLRMFPGPGQVVWGARTLAGSDVLASEWKYVPVRRLALFLEESLCRGTQWAVFEANDEALWAQLRLQVETFMQTLFRQGAFQGTSPREAYYVACGRDTTTQADIDAGVIIIEVGFAPLKPAEFVVLRIRVQAMHADDD